MALCLDGQWILSAINSTFGDNSLLNTELQNGSPSSVNYTQMSTVNGFVLSADACLPYCSVECRNGGVCVGPEECQCLEQYYGGSCQYRACLQPLPQLLHGNFSGSGFVSRELVCHEGYTAVSVNTTAFCSDGVWKLRPATTSTLNTTALCAPVCSTPCRHGGECVAPETCHCTTSYMGQHCQHQKCLQPLPLLRHGSIYNISLESAELSCKPGYVIPPSGTAGSPLITTTAMVVCERGRWKLMGGSAGTGAPDEDTCIPHCSSPCIHGGSCTSPDTCTCTPDYTGATCHARVCRVDGEGDVKTNADGEKELQCPAGHYLTGNLSRVVVACGEDGKWRGHLDGKTQEPVCVGGCLGEPCLNGGACSGVQSCTCDEHFYGQICELRACASNAIDNGYLSVHNSSSATLTCEYGFGVLDTDHRETPTRCEDGSWVVMLPDVEQNLTSSHLSNFSSTVNTQPASEGIMDKRSALLTGRGPLTTKDSSYSNLSLFRTKDTTIKYLEEDNINLTNSQVIHKNVKLIRSSSSTISADQEDINKETIELETTKTINKIKDVTINKSRNANKFPTVPKSNNDKYSNSENSVITNERIIRIARNTTTEPIKHENSKQMNLSNYKTIESRSFLPRTRHMTDLPSDTSSKIKDTSTVKKTLLKRDVVVGRAPKCRSLCSQPCANGGTCVAREACACVPGYAGHYCSLAVCSHTPISNGSINMNATDTRLECNTGHFFPSGSTSTEAVCDEGDWLYPNMALEDLRCSPGCTEHPCLNGGVCVAVRRCWCPHGYEGEACEQQPCTAPLPIVLHGQINKEKMLVECDSGYEATESWSSGTAVQCSGGLWVILHTDGSLLPPRQCLPACECTNGGVCVRPGVCDCSSGYTGPTCSTRTCPTPPTAVPGGTITVGDKKPVSSAVMSCIAGQFLATGKTKLTFRCTDGDWTLEHEGERTNILLSTVSCSEGCPEGCLNGGLCVGINKCSCLPGYAGKKCQMKTCSNDVASQVNGRIQPSYATPAEHYLECYDNHKLATGSTRAEVRCMDLVWQPADQKQNFVWTPKYRNEEDTEILVLAIHPSLYCLPVCNPVCENGGSCISPGVCYCKEPFVGELCQWQVCKEQQQHEGPGGASSGAPQYGRQGYQQSSYVMTLNYSSSDSSNNNNSNKVLNG